MNLPTLISKKTIAIAGAIVLLGSFVTLCFAVNGYFAHQEDHLALVASFNYELYKQRANDLQGRIWMLEDRYQKTPMPVHVKSEIRQLQLELEEIKQELKHLMKKKS